MLDRSAVVAQLDNSQPPSFRAEMTTVGGASESDARVRIDYAAADRWKAIGEETVSLRNGARAWTIHPDRVFVQFGDRAARPFARSLWAAYRSKDHHIDSVREVELDDGRPGYAVDVTYRSGEATAQWELVVDRDSGLVRRVTSSSADRGTTVEVRLDAVDYAPAFTDQHFEAVIPPTAKVFDETQGSPGVARGLLIGLVARAALVWNRFRHPERLQSRR